MRHQSYLRILIPNSVEFVLAWRQVAVQAKRAGWAQTRRLIGQTHKVEHTKAHWE